MEETHTLPWLLAPYLSAFGKFFFLSNSSPCCCPAALTSFLLFLGNLGVDLLSAPVGDCASGGQPGGWAGNLSLCSVTPGQKGLRAGRAASSAHRLAASSGSLGPQWAPCWPPPDFWPGLRPGGAWSPWPGGADRHQMGGQCCLLGTGWTQRRPRSRLGMSSMEGLPPEGLCLRYPAPAPFWLGANPEGAQWAKPSEGLWGLAHPLHPEAPSGSGAGQAWVTLSAFPVCTPIFR